ncbi:hypothetical protein D3C77_300940 [compost metagenome]
MTVGYQLTCTSTGVGEAQTVNKIVQTSLEEEHEVLTRDTAHFLRFVEQSAELLLAETVHVAKLLFLLKLHAVVANFSALGRAMLSRRERALQFFSSTAQGNAKTAAKFKFRTSVTCHCIGRLL